MIGGDDDALACMIFACMNALGSHTALVIRRDVGFRSEILECVSATGEQKYMYSSSPPLLLLFSDSKAASA